MKLRTILVTSSCLLALGCAAEVDDTTARTAPAHPFELTIDGVGIFEGRAEYEVSEPTDDYMPVPSLVLHGLQAGDDGAVVLKLGQSNPGDIAADYDFPGQENAFYVELEGKAFEGRVGAVRLDVDGKLEGRFELESADVDGPDKRMLQGRFAADQVFLNCNKLTDDKTVASPGRSDDGSEVFWEPDTRHESPFCARMRDALGGLYGG